MDCKRKHKHKHPGARRRRRRSCRGEYREKNRLGCRENSRSGREKFRMSFLTKGSLLWRRFFPSQGTGFWGGSRSLKHKMQKARAKIEARSEESNGVNLNPLAPAKSKRTCSFSEKPRHSNQHVPIPAPCLFCIVRFSNLFQKSRKRGPESSPRDIRRCHTKTPRVPKQIPIIKQMNAKPPQVLQWSPRFPQPKCKKCTTWTPNVLVRHEQIL